MLMSFFIKRSSLESQALELHWGEPTASAEKELIIFQDTIGVPRDIQRVQAQQIAMSMFEKVMIHLPKLTSTPESRPS